MTKFLQNLLRLKRSAWELVASVLIMSGVIMLMQPLSMLLYTYSFVVILTGTALFIVASHFRS